MLVEDINPGSNSAAPRYLTSIDGTLFFSANDGTHGSELWKSDGTAAGTELVADIHLGRYASYPKSLTNVNGTLFFIANDGTHGRELWKSDGTATGTVLVADINPSSTYSSSSGPSGLTNVDGTLFFSANDGITRQRAVEERRHGRRNRHWSSDINPGSRIPPPSNLTNVNGTLFFTANDGTHGRRAVEE